MSRVRSKADVLEDLAFLDEHLVGAFEAAERTGFPSAEAMEKWLERANLAVLWQRFKRRDPPGAHDVVTRTRGRKKMAKDEPAVPEEPEDVCIDTILEQAAESTRARTRAKAEKIGVWVDELRAILQEESEDDVRLEEIAKLEDQLRELKAGVKRSPGAAAPSPYLTDASVIREWAAEQGIECPDRGRVPSKVRQAYEQAHHQEGDPK